MLEGIVDAILAFVAQYGYVALFVFMFCETSMTFPFGPSEIVVPVAAALLVSGPASFVAFVVVATAGATIGSVFAYYVFGTTSHEALDRYGDHVHVSDREVDRASYWFRRWGESSVFWGRLLPFLRSLISIPAGFAGMDVRKFTVYSAAGSALFTTTVAALVSVGAEHVSLSNILALVASGVVYFAARPLLTVGTIGVLVAATLVAWRMVVRRYQAL